MDYDPDYISPDIAESALRSRLPRRQAQEAVQGWREWRLLRHDQSGDLVLASAVAMQTWEGPVAHSDRPMSEDPDPHGLYAWKLLCARPDPMLFPIRGHVLLYGTVMAHQYGYRAEHALVQDLTLCYAQGVGLSIVPNYWSDAPNTMWWGIQGYEEIFTSNLSIEQIHEAAAELSRRYDCPVDTLDITPLVRELWTSESR